MTGIRTAVRGIGAAAAAAAIVAGLAPIDAALAQQKKAPPAAAAPAGAPAKQQSVWLKLCEDANLARRDKDGKEIRETKVICMTLHERLNPATGGVIISAALREVSGTDNKFLMFMVPLGTAIQPGMKAAVYSKELWAKLEKNEKVDEKLLNPVALKFSLCTPPGCTAEMEVTPEFMKSMQEGGGIMVLALNAAAQPVGFPIPLAGFKEANAGKPIDNKVYAEARGKLMSEIRERQKEIFEKAQQAQAAAQGNQQPAAAAQPEAKKK